MKRRIKQFAVVCFVAAAISGIGNVFVHADYNGVPDKVTINGSKRSVVQGKKFRHHRTVQRMIISVGRLFLENLM